MLARTAEFGQERPFAVDQTMQTRWRTLKIWTSFVTMTGHAPIWSRLFNCLQK